MESHLTTECNTMIASFLTNNHQRGGAGKDNYGMQCWAASSN